MTAHLGIDVGTASVRAVLVSNNKVYTDSQPINRYSHPVHSNFITQSSNEIWQAVLKCTENVISQCNCTQVKGIAVAATCSMVVFKDGRPLACDFDQKHPDQNIILWMDSRAQRQAQHLTQIVPEYSRNSVGGKFIPEMGLCKLKWLESGVETWELHDWISYKFLDHQPEFINHSTKNIAIGVALDGNIKGWDSQTLESAGINNKTIQPVFSTQKYPEVFPLGTKLGTIHNFSSIPQLNGALVRQGCIDCYAGWIATILKESPFSQENCQLSSNVMYMIAGTSTCFIVPSNDNSATTINGVWGPYQQLLPGKFVYQSGQNATGKLYEDLMQEFDNLLNFDQLEQETAQLEQTAKLSITQIIRHYFYSGDRYGNRCPMNNSQLGAIIIDGQNGSNNSSCNMDHGSVSHLGLPSLFDNNSKLTMVIKYNLIMEFLSLQTSDIIDKMNLNINTLVVSGSQAQNKRFMQLLADCTNCEIMVPISDENFEMFTVGLGATLIAKNTLIGHVTDYQRYTPNCSFNKLFNIKKAFLQDLSQLMCRFHASMDKYL